MQHRILDFSLFGARLRVRNRQLLVFQEKEPLASIPLDDIAVVILAHPEITVSQAVMEGLCQAGAVMVFCDRKSLPVGLGYPLIGHHLQSRHMQVQASAPKPLLKQLWRQVVRKKIEFQGVVLSQLFKDDFGLGTYAHAVRSGDTDNREGLAAKRYWSKLFEGTEFRRSPEGKDPANTALNYGYGILRALTARAISASGLHPSLGIFHHNKYNPYCLADDLMEPFRPVVDICVRRLFFGNCLSDGLNSRVKACIIEQMTGRYTVKGCQETLFEATSKVTESLVRVFMEKQRDLELPQDLPLNLVAFSPSRLPETVTKQGRPQEELPF